MHRLRRLLTACGVALALTVATAAVTSSASAATSTTQTGVPVTPAQLATAKAPAGVAQQGPTVASMSCPAHSLCLWKNANFGSTRWVFTLDKPWQYNTWYSVGSGANNQASSIYNARGYCAFVAKTWPIESGDEIVQLDPGVAYNNLTKLVWPDGSSMNDSISAFALLNYCD